MTLIIVMLRREPDCPPLSLISTELTGMDCLDRVNACCLCKGPTRCVSMHFLSHFSPFAADMHTRQHVHVLERLDLCF